jgi:hypothetical protein
MAQYYVEVRVDFSGYLEAESEDEAEQMAFTAWGEDLGYDGVYSVEVEAVMEDEEEEEEDNE